MKMARYSEAHKRANMKYQAKKYYRVSTCFPKELEGAIREKAEFYGSVNAYLQFLVQADLGITPTEPTNEPFEDAP